MRRRCLVLRVLLVFLGVVAYASPGAAQVDPSTPAERSAVVVIDAGTADLFVESLVRSAVEAKLEGHGYRIVSGVAVGGDTPTRLLACSGDLACAVATMSGITAQYVIFLSLRSDEPGETAKFKIVARSYEVTTGKAVARIMRRCESCIEDAALATFAEGVATELMTESTPTLVEPVAPVPAPAPVVAAPRPVAAPLTIGAPEERASSSLNLVDLAKYTSLGLGVVGLAAGTVLVLMDGPVINDGLRAPEANDTLTIGFASLGAGVALVGLSAWLWSSASDSESEALVLKAGTDTASFVYSGDF